MALVSQAEHARRCGVSRKSVTAWKAAGKLVTLGGLVDFQRSYRGEHRPASAPSAPDESIALLDRAELEKRLRALDWRSLQDWTSAGQRRRVAAACLAVGLVPVESELRDDGHHGGWQLRRADPAEGCSLIETIVAGFGFELDAPAVLHACRLELCRTDRFIGDDGQAQRIVVDLALLPALAQPFAHWHGRPGP